MCMYESVCIYVQAHIYVHVGQGDVAGWIYICVCVCSRVYLKDNASASYLNPCKTTVPLKCVCIRV